MTSKDLKIFFQNSYKKLQTLIEDKDDLLPLSSLSSRSIENWKKDVLSNLTGSSKIKMQNVEIIKSIENPNDFKIPYYNEVDLSQVKIAETILRDNYFKFIDKKTKKNIETLKLLQAREENLRFEAELADMICGDNTKFPYRSSYYLTEFFQSLGHNFIHDGQTRSIWVKDRLNELDITEIYRLITTGLFKRKYFIDEFKKLSNQNRISNDQNFDDYFKTSVLEFKEFIKNSLSANEPFDLSSVLDMNVNIELLFDGKANTSDKELNKLIEEAKERFFNPNDKQVALEKLWDAFERLKTFFTNQDKKRSAEKVIEVIRKNFDKEFLEDEFKKLTKIGNDYRIRHHETNKLELTNEHINYFFFRMLSLIDLCIVFLEKEEPDLF